jgi:CDP-glycerol glycerophosphotransferase (TagB/SpsB family)
MNKRYLFFVSLTYSYSILRPIQEEIRRRGGEAAWFIEEPCENKLEPGEKHLATIEDVMAYDPIAVIAPGNWVYDFFPGVKVEVFHGYAMKKRVEKIDDHFSIRGWFDIYCSQGPSSTPYFRELEAKYGYFKVYETGWCKVDPFFEPAAPVKHERPVILYAPTFSKNITSAPLLYDTIKELIETKPWDWIITFHPKLDDPELIAKYRQLAKDHPHVQFPLVNDGLPTFRKIDAMLCDSSSIIVEVLMLEKPVVTFRNTHPGDFLIDVQQPDEVGPALERALSRPPELLEEMLKYTTYHEPHRDGKNSARVLDAIDDFITNYKGKIRRKPFNLFRKLKLRRQLKYYHW